MMWGDNLIAEDDGMMIVHPSVYEKIMGSREMSLARMRAARGLPPARGQAQELLCRRRQSVRDYDPEPDGVLFFLFSLFSF